MAEHWFLVGHGHYEPLKLVEKNRDPMIRVPAGCILKTFAQLGDEIEAGKLIAIAAGQKVSQDGTSWEPRNYPEFHVFEPDAFVANRSLWPVEEHVHAWVEVEKKLGQQAASIASGTPGFGSFAHVFWPPGRMSLSDIFRSYFAPGAPRDPLTRSVMFEVGGTPVSNRKPGQRPRAFVLYWMACS